VSVDAEKRSTKSSYSMRTRPGSRIGPLYYLAAGGSKVALHMRSCGHHGSLELGVVGKVDARANAHVGRRLGGEPRVEAREEQRNGIRR